MAIAVQIHDKDPQALAEVIEKTIHEGVVLDSEPEVGTLAALVANEEREGDKRRAAWHWLNFDRRHRARPRQRLVRRLGPERLAVPVVGRRRRG